MNFWTCSSFTEAACRPEIDAGRAEQAAHGLLRKILRANAGVAGPLVGGGVRAVIHRDEGEFVQPAGDVALRGDEAGSETAAHRDAQDGVVAKRHGTGERRDFAIIDHVEGNAVPGGLKIEEEAADARVELIARNAR